MREASVRRTKPPAGNPRCGSVPCGADRRARATKQAAAAAGPGPTPRGVWSRCPAARGLLCYVLLERACKEYGMQQGIEAGGLQPRRRGAPARRVLVVEDNVDSALLLAELLRRTG